MSRTSIKQGHCEILGGCGKPATMRYPAMGGGYMRLCERHGAKHANYCERWTPDGWQDVGGRVAGWMRSACDQRPNQYQRGYQAGYHAGQRSMTKAAVA